MSKLYTKYLELKNKNNSKYYMFESGLFDIFLAEDAKKISNITTLKLTRLNEDIEKCGFPRNSRDKYMKIFNNLDMDIVIVKDIIDVDKKIINKIKKLDLDNLTPVMALNIIIELRKMIDE